MVVDLLPHMTPVVEAFSANRKQMVKIEITFLLATDAESSPQASFLKTIVWSEALRCLASCLKRWGFKAGG